MIQMISDKIDQYPFQEKYNQLVDDMVVTIKVSLVLYGNRIQYNNVNLYKHTVS